MTTTSESRLLRIYLFGSTGGESIVLHLPNGKWGVVDSFADALKDPATNPAYNLLKSKDVTELEFVCLTHPHADHFRGMSQILGGFRTKQFWTFFGPDPTDVGLLKTYFSAEAVQMDRTAFTEEARELASIFDIVDAGKIDRQHVVSRRPMYPVPRDPNVDVAVRGIAPTDKLTTIYKKLLLRSLATKPGKVEAIPREKHNVISIGLMIEFGASRILLGGDIENKAWQTILDENPPQDLVSHFVKISHHGSRTGYCPGLWSVLSAQGSAPPVAALTPCKLSKLPDPVALDHIRDHTRSIYSASRLGHAERTENWRIAALAKLKAASAGKISAGRLRESVGCCEIEVTERGECRVNVHPPACAVHERRPA